jgi:pimeloyl-ACP methyl ester carboxylesterase
MKKPALLFLHGALGCAESFAEILPHFQAHFTCYILDFEGHGKRLNGSYSMDNFVQNVREFIAENQLTDVRIFGYSMGGYVALDYASKYLGVAHVYTLGTKFEWSPEIATRETRSLDAAFLLEKAPQFTAQLMHYHGENAWKNVLSKTAKFMTELGATAGIGNVSWETCTTPVTLIRASDDKMVSNQETEVVHKRMKHASLHSVVGKHGLETVDHTALVQILLNA